MGTGPSVGPGYDLALTERTGSEGRQYLVDVGSDDGADVLEHLPRRDATETEIASARDDVAEAANHMGRQMPAGDLRNLLVDARESPHWDEVASRCLTCGNCTMVCPTCFCTSVSDVTDLTGEHAERWMEWASCFEFDFTFVHEAASANPAHRDTATGSPTNWAPGTTSSALRAASVAGAVSLGAPRGSTSPRR
jgi:ferredoxin